MDIKKMQTDKDVVGLMAVLKNEDEHVRRQAAMSLAQMGNVESVPALIEALKDTSEHVRLYAAEALGAIKDKKAVGPLIEALRDSDPFVRRHAMIALGRIGDTKAVKPLVEALRDIGWVRLEAARSLGRIGDAKVVKAAVASLLELFTGKDFVIQQQAKSTLADMGELAVEPLTEAMKSDNVYIATTADDALIEMATSNEMSHVELIMKHVMKILKDKKARHGAIKVLGQIGDSKVVKPLIQILFKDKDELTRAYAARMLGVLAVRNIGTNEAVKALNQAQSDESEHVRRDAKRALNNIT